MTKDKDTELKVYECEICGWTFMGNVVTDRCIMCDAAPDNDPDDGSWVGR